MMIAELRHAVLTRNSEFVVRNVRQSVARMVTVKLDPPLPDPESLRDGERAGLLTPFLQRRYSRVIPTFAPGILIDNYYQDAEDPDEPLPNDFSVTISYSDGRGRKFVDTYELTMGTSNDQTAGYPSNMDESGLQGRVARAVEAMARGVGRH